MKIFSNTVNTWKRNFRRPAPDADIFEIGPHPKTNQAAVDICRERPYFLIPLLNFGVANKANVDPFEDIRKRMLREIPKYVSQQGKKITDIYIVSHGWHRNVYAAVSAYDRLMSRFCILMRRGKLECSKEYNPLFIAVHWHSDPGPEGWASRSGGHSKESFLANAAGTFVAMNGAPPFKDVFEEIFALMNRAAMEPDTVGTFTSLREEPIFQAHAQQLAVKLGSFQIKDAPTATLDEKITAAWTCYYEATGVSIHLDQDAKPARFNTISDSFVTLFKFLLAVVGVASLLSNPQGIYGAVLHLFRICEKIPAVFQSIYHWIIKIPILGLAISAIINAIAPLINSATHLAIQFWDIVIIQWHQWLLCWRWPFPFAQYIISLLVLIAAYTLVFLVLPGAILCLIGCDQKFRGNKNGAKTPWLAIAVWFPMQIALTLPALIVAILSYLSGGIPFKCGPLRKILDLVLFSERQGNRNADPTFKRIKLGNGLLRIGNGLAKLARFPFALLDLATPQDSSIRGISSTLDYQLAFWEMQKKGTVAGEALATFLFNLYTDKTFRDVAGDARIHCAAHSFGALVITNMIRHLRLNGEMVLSTANKNGEDRIKFHSVCLIQGALACNWFEKEAAIVQGIQSAIACVYSRYDFATGFYYPLANFARCAIGFRGLLPLNGRPTVSFIPADIRQLAKLEQGNATALVDAAPLLLPITANYLNIDASHLACDGSVALGGGHDDIFKDEIIEIMWEVTRWNTPPVVTPEITSPMPDA